jgi:DNA-binding protein YbaB
MDADQIMQQAQAMQIEMQKLQAGLGEIEVEGYSNDKRVTARTTCKGKVLDLTFPEEASMEELARMTIEALNDAKARADETLSIETKKMMTKMGLPSDIEMPG